MIEKASEKRRNFPASERLLAHWKDRRQAVGRGRRRAPVDEADRIVDPGFDDVRLDDLLADLAIGPSRRADDGEDR